MNLPLRPAPEIQALLFRDLNLGLPYGWGVQNAFFYAQAGAAFLHKAIDLIVEHVERGDYGLMPFSVTGPGLFGRALALNGEKTGHVYGDRIPLTPLHAKKNFAFVLPDGAILAWAKQTGHGGDLTPYGETAGNNYMQMWKDRDIFRE